MKSLALALTLMACVTTSFTERDGVVTIHGGLGGDIGENFYHYLALHSRADRIIVDGHIISADAYFAFMSPKACYTANVIWSPHAISTIGFIPRRKETVAMASHMPEPLREWFLANACSWQCISYPNIGYEQLRDLWPEGEC